MLVVGCLIMFSLFMIGVPIWLALMTGGTFLLLFFTHSSVLTVAMQFFSSVDSFTLMAIPFFLLGGAIMAHCGPAKYIYDAINAWFGRIKGGLAFSAVVMCMVYAAITGSNSATLAGVADICTPPMEKAGYSRKFIAGMLACSSTLGQLIPPSCYMIVYGSIVQENVGTLFISGIIPGIICGLAIGIWAIIKNPLKIDENNEIFSWKNRFTTLWKGFPALIMPIIVLGGIYTGFFTPTEAGAMAVVYGIFISVFVYRTMDWKVTKKTFIGATRSHGMVFIVISGAMIFAQSLTYARIPQRISEIVIEQGFGRIEFLLASSALFLILGCFLDPMPILFLVVPVLLPALKNLDINLMHFNVISIICMQISTVTPPYGMSLYVSSGLLKVPVEDVIKTSMPFLAVMVLVLLLIIFVPELSLFLPNMMH